MEPFSRNDSFTGRIKRYPDGSMEVLACNRAVFHGADWVRPIPPEEPITAAEYLRSVGLAAAAEEAEYAELERAAKDEADAPEEAGASSADRARRRARARVRDIALCTPFTYFVTLTIDPAKLDRYDIDAITRRMRVWLDNRVRRDGLAYVLVPELHRDGAVHFHGFFNDALPTVDSGTMTGPGQDKPRKIAPSRREELLAAGWRVVFNLPCWEYGWTTAMQLYGDYHAAVGYVCKYVSKQAEKIGGRWYYSGGALCAPEVDLLDIEWDDIASMPGGWAFQPTEALKFARAFVRPRKGGEVSDAIL